MEMGTYYMTSFLGEYSRALLERPIEGGFNFADCIITPDGFTMMNRCVENMELLKTNEKNHRTESGSVSCTIHSPNESPLP